MNTEQMIRDLRIAAANTVIYYASLEPELVCLYNNLNPCQGLRHWGGGAACPLCSARAALASTDGGAA